MTAIVARLPDVDWLAEPPLSALLATLDGGGEETRINGGSVRDALLGLPRGDVDLATTATPDVVVARAAAAGWRTVPTGIDHGTVTVVISGRPFEVTTLRRDVATHGRRATIAFTRDWAEDARRRDLTINGLFADREGRVYDHVGGLADLRAGRVRFIGDARERIREDYLRALRFFRFHARYAEGPIDRQGFAAAIAERDGLATLSAERVRAELLKLLVAPRAAETVETMAGAGLFAILIGGVPRPSRFAAFVARDGAAPDALLRLSALAQATSEDAARLRKRLRLSNAEGRRLDAIGDRTPFLSPATEEAAARRQIYVLGAEAFRDRVRLGWAEDGAGSDDNSWQELLTLPDRWSRPKQPVSAAELLKRGVPAGPRMGRTLRAIEAAWIAAGFPDDPGSLNKLIEGAISGAE
ncbi:CCA tRNA nucleotidyltransferase [Hansschlegelia sp. KR7-227]|uniref:CCA tRNA nucleotidyltransferase n=1 Tax=Hansschlegelia sp. KR7-227 TaxID=3400914 RepID=UPI003C11CDE3